MRPQTPSTSANPADSPGAAAAGGGQAAPQIRTGSAAAGAASGGGPPAAEGRPGGALDKSGAAIQAMFGKVARRYDLLNHLLSAGLDLVWRRRAAAAAAADLPAGALVLDLCCGTGDQAVALRKRGARVAAADFCLPMLALARPKLGRLRAPRPAPLAADALALPFPAGRFGGATVAFGLRNVADLDAALGQLAIVLAPGARLQVLEFAVPRVQPLRALYLFYFRHLLPLLGRLVSDSSSAYDYLPSSVLQFPQRQGFLDRMAAAGFGELAWRDFSGGIVCLYSGAIPKLAPPAGLPPSRSRGPGSATAYAAAAERPIAAPPGGASSGGLLASGLFASGSPAGGLPASGLPAGGLPASGLLASGLLAGGQLAKGPPDARPLAGGPLADSSPAGRPSTDGSLASGSLAGRQLDGAPRDGGLPASGSPAGGPWAGGAPAGRPGEAFFLRRDDG